MQPVSGYSWTRVNGTAAGTTVIKPGESRLHSVFLGNNTTGTISVYDSATAAGATGTTIFGAINNTSGTIPQTLLFDARFRTGITVILGGTTDMTFIYE